MSSYYEINDIKCAYCRVINKEVTYHTEMFETFKCDKCGKENKIKMKFSAEKTKQPKSNNIKSKATAVFFDKEGYATNIPPFSEDFKKLLAKKKKKAISVTIKPSKGFIKYCKNK